MKRSLALEWGYRLLATLVATASVFPLLYAFATSLKKGTALFSPSLWVSNPTFDNYRSLFEQQSFGRNLFNSLLVASGVVLFSLALSLLAAWALGRVGRYDEALAALERAWSTGYRDAVLEARAAWLCDRKGATSEAARHREQASSLDPGYMTDPGMFALMSSKP